MTVRRTIMLAVGAALAATVARSGHELPVYPSYYPHEIEIATVAPDAAADLLTAGKLHAYVGAVPKLADAPPNTIGSAESLGSLVVVRINPASPLAGDETARCAALGAIVRDLAARADAGALTVHPYPVTPWHGDYLNHADRADEARQRLLHGETAQLPGDLKVRAASGLGRSLVRPERLTDGADWDVTIEEVSAAGLVADATAASNGWLGPRWVRSGWFQTYRVLAGAMHDPARKQEAEGRFARLAAADYAGSVERINLERDLVQTLLSGCGALVGGYTVRRNVFNTQFSAGIENISYDALEGFSSPMFLRTVKLKDFPWNGWLYLGLDAAADAAWNPVGGFTDPFGRLLWYAVADPAAIPSPYEAGWVLNRISEVEAWPRE